MRLVPLLTLAALLPVAACTGPTSEPGTAPHAATSGTVWVANEHDDSISVLDAATGAPMATLTGVAAPHNIQASPTRDTVWVTSAGGVLGLHSRELYATHAEPAGDHPAHVVETTDGHVLVTAAGDDLVHRFDTELQPLGTTPTGDGPHGMRATADGSLVAVANTAAGTVTLLRGDREDTVAVGPSPIQVAVTVDGATVYVAVAGTREVVRVDVATGSVTGRTRVPSAPAQLWVTDTGQVISANQGDAEAPGNTVSILDGATLTVAATVAVGAGPHGVTADPAGTTAWVTNLDDDSVTAIDLGTATVRYTVAVGDYPNGITYVPGALPAPTQTSRALLLPDAYTGAGQPTGDDGHAHPPAAGHSAFPDPTAESDDAGGHGHGGH